MTLVERLTAALEHGRRGTPELLEGDMTPFELEGAPAPAEAAVLVAITDRAEPGVLLTERNANLRKHPGQVAFPGGRIDPDDHDAIAAALREAQEEIALDPAAVTVIGAVDSYRTGTGYRVTPVLGVIAPDLPLIPAEDEVADVFEVPLSVILDPARHTRAVGMWKGKERHYYQIEWQDRRIWGATAAMIVNLSRRLAW
ncbi:CoA pyrophosphatase [Sphingomonas donggukensis]|uniref:CoA pyrophosphatase n=1 Tax=Sphingomonas donggukensis TaxID=2949093 RepID=A0ABY4TWT4_9SPHN|nr:CoA pyrophosphatase [Sphingomonas donggukensis]URW76865.1 CoA pyrophosphatase [Sphingomonas donggukensis]